MESLYGGHREGLCGPTAVDGLKVRNQGSSRAAQHSLREINYWSHGNECLFGEKRLYDDSVWFKWPQGQAQERGNYELSQRIWDTNASC